MSNRADAIEGEPPQLLERNLVTAGHLLASATAFFFLAFLFAYLYLRSVDEAALWHPAGVDRPIWLGTVVMALVVAGAAAVRFALGDDRAGRMGPRTAKLGLGLGLGVAALVVQVVLWSTMDFGPTDGGYASVFVGWTGFYFAFTLLALYWVETQLATALRHREARLAGLDALSFFWAFLAGIGFVSWIVLYLVAP